MKGKILAFALGLVAVIASFGVACGADNRESNSSADSAVESSAESSVESSVESSINSSEPETPTTIAAIELFPWIQTLTADDVVLLERETYSGVPGLLTNVTRSAERIDIENMLSYLKTLTVTAIPIEEGQVSGGGGIKVTLTTSSKEYVAQASNGIFYVNGKYYRLCENIPEIATTVYHRFVHVYGDSVLYIDGEEIKNLGDLVHKMLFVEKEDKKGFTYTGYEIEFDGGRLTISDEKTFGFARYGEEGTFTVYTIVGDRDFSQIFAEYPLPV